MKIKKILIMLLLCLFCTSTTFAADISLNINGVYVETDAAPKIVNGRTMVPVRTIFEGIGASVEWYPETKTIVGTKDETTVIMIIGSNTEKINNTTVEMDISPQIIDGRTYAPAKYVAEAFGYEVSWDANTKTVNIYGVETNVSNNNLGIDNDKYEEILGIYYVYYDSIIALETLDDVKTFILEECIPEESDYYYYIQNADNANEKDFALALYYATFCLSSAKGMDIIEGDNSSSNFNGCLSEVNTIFDATSEAEMRIIVEDLHVKYGSTDLF